MWLFQSIKTKIILNGEIFMLASNFFYTYNIIFDTNVSSYAKLVYSFFCKCADKNGCSYPSHKLIAKECGIGRTSVKKAVSELETAKLIESRGQVRVDGGRRSNLYTIIKDKINGFFTAYSLVFINTLSAKAKLVYLYFCRLAGNDKSVYPSHKTTANACGLSVSTTRKAIDELEEVGIIEREAQYRENGGQRSNLYFMANELNAPIEFNQQPIFNDTTMVSSNIENDSSNAVDNEFKTDEIKAVQLCSDEHEDVVSFCDYVTPHSQNTSSSHAAKRLAELKPIMTKIYNDIKTLIIRKKNLIKISIVDRIVYERTIIATLKIPNKPDG